MFVCIIWSIVTLIPAEFVGLGKTATKVSHGYNFVTNGTFLFCNLVK